MNASPGAAATTGSNTIPREDSPGSVQASHQISETLLGVITWETVTKGFCECPGEHLHASGTGSKDCVVYLNKVPTLHCVHQSCRKLVDESNRRLRQAISRGAPDGLPQRDLKEVAACIERRQRERELVMRTEASRAGILEGHPWPLKAIMEESPYDLSAVPPENGWRFVVSLFQPNDLIWIGNKRSSGFQYKRNFQTREAWLGNVFGNYQLTCPSVFKNGTCHRKNENVVARRFLVVESDVLGKNEVGAVFRWLRDSIGMTLRAVVDTAGKSLHAWFDFPPEEVFLELNIILPALQCDKGMFTASQPCRLPGMLRDGKIQTLIYLNP